MADFTPAQIAKLREGPALHHRLTSDGHPSQADPLNYFLGGMLGYLAPIRLRALAESIAPPHYRYDQPVPLDVQQHDLHLLLEEVALWRRREAQREEWRPLSTDAATPTDPA